MDERISSDIIDGNEIVVSVKPGPYGGKQFPLSINGSVYRYYCSKRSAMRMFDRIISGVQPVDWASFSA